MADDRRDNEGPQRDETHPGMVWPNQHPKPGTPPSAPAPIPWPPAQFPGQWMGPAQPQWPAQQWNPWQPTPIPLTPDVNAPLWPGRSPLVAPPSTWQVGVVPWGYTSPPPVPPVVEAPGRFHPRSPRRRIASLAGRASPRGYLFGLLLGLPFGLLLLVWEIATRGGFKLGHAPVAPWVLVDLISALAALGLISAAAAQGAQRRADGWRDFTGPSPLLVGAAQQALVIALGLPFVALLSSFKVDETSAFGTLLIVPVYLLTYFGLVHLLGVRPGAMTWPDILHPRRLAPNIDEWTATDVAERLGWRRVTSGFRRRLRGSLGDVLLAAAVLIPVVAATALTNLVLLTVLGLDSSDLQSDVPLHHNALELAVTFLSVAILIPIGEEVFFRGYCTNAWGRSLARSSAILRAGLFFAFIHVVNTSNTDFWLSIRAALFNFGARIPVALVLCWIYMRRRSLVASMSLHGAYNGIIVLISYFATASI